MDFVVEGREIDFFTRRDIDFVSEGRNIDFFTNMARLANAVFETSPVRTTEIIPITVDFAADMASGETIASTVITLVDKSSVDRKTDIFDSTEIQTGAQASSKVQIVLSAFVDLERYKVTVTALIESAVKDLTAVVFVPVKDV